jgi:hypothetical protein
MNLLRKKECAEYSRLIKILNSWPESVHENPTDYHNAICEKIEAMDDKYARMGVCIEGYCKRYNVYWA